MERLLSWEAMLAIVLGLPGIGLAFLALDDFKIAKLCFVGAAADAVGFIVWQAPNMDSNTTWRAVFVFVVVGMIGVLADQSLKYVDRKKEQKEHRPTVTAGINSRMVACLYARAVDPGPGQTINIPFSFQEIFYEWSTSVSADRLSKASLKVDALREDDIYRVEPEGAVVKRVPESALGFKNLTAKPDYYALMINTDDLNDSQPLTVTVRRSTTIPLTESELIRLAYVRSSTSKVINPKFDAAADVERLKRQGKIIAKWKHAPRTEPLPIHSPGEVPSGWIQSSIEMWCKDESCQEMVIGNLVARWNRVTR